jgi:hypothetical protein
MTGTAVPLGYNNDEDVMESIINRKEKSTVLLICCPDVGPRSFANYQTK